MDHTRLLDLVAEYAVKLRTVCDAYDERKRRTAVRIFFTVLVTVFYFCLIYAAFKDTGRPDRPIEIKILVTVLLYGGLSLPGYFVYKSWYDLKRSAFEIRPLARGLESLVSRASQLEDHAIENMDERLIFSLRIGEGLSALEYANWVTRSSWTLGLLWWRTKPSEFGLTRQYRSSTLSL